MDEDIDCYIHQIAYHERGPHRRREGSPDRGHVAPDQRRVLGRVDRHGAKQGQQLLDAPQHGRKAEARPRRREQSVSLLERGHIGCGLEQLRGEPHVLGGHAAGRRAEPAERCREERKVTEALSLAIYRIISVNPIYIYNILQCIYIYIYIYIYTYIYIYI